MCNAYEKVHVSGALKGKIQLTDATRWPWFSDEGKKELPFHEFLQKFEKCNAIKYVEKWSGRTCSISFDDVRFCVRALFSRDEYTLHLKKSDAACVYRCYSITDKLHRDGENTTSIIVHNQSKMPVYIIDVAKDDDIIEAAELSQDWDNGAAAFVAAFEKKYGKK